jgi:glycosyltransferase involved in cell wall biosynthesis
MPVPSVRLVPCILTLIFASVRNFRSSIIVSTYNRPDALGKCIESILRQTTLPYEIVIADDGSGKATQELVHQFQKKSPVALIHVWQEDNGYQLARIRNRSFAAAKGDYLIQIDGDLILEKHFIEDHLSMAQTGTFVAGARTMMNETLTQWVLAGQVPFEDIASHRKYLGRKSNSVRSAILSRLNYLYQRNQQNYKYVLGCNMAFWKKDLLSVNGYNEAFTGWGKEDNELSVRLQNAGIKLRFIKFGAIVYHLYHKVADLSSMQVNEEKLRQTIKERLTFASSGISNYLQNH